MNHQPTRIAGQGAVPCAPPFKEAPEGPQETSNDTFLDPWRTARSEAAQSLLALIMRNINEQEARTGARQRARRHDDQIRWEEMVEAVVAALALQVIARGGRLAIPLSHRQVLPGRYKRPTQGERLGHLLDLLDQCGFAHVEKGRKHGVATTIAPSDLLIDLVFSQGLTSAHFGHSNARELLVLRLSERQGGKRVKRNVDYPETDQTTRLRAAVRLHNEHLAAADIRFVGNGSGVDVYDRAVRRHFTTFDLEEVRFDQGGRFFGGFWQKLKKGDRRHILISGEPAAEVDYSAAFAHIAFALVGETAPQVGDLYAIPGLEGLGRKQVKAAFNTFLFDQGDRRNRWPTDFHELMWSDPDTGEVFEGFPAEYTPSRVRKAILAHYPVLSKALGTGIGYRLMFLESEIMGRVLTALHERGLIGLPLHDALVVPRSVAPEVSSLMEVMALEVIGLTIPAKVSFSPLLPYYQ